MNRLTPASFAPLALLIATLPACGASPSADVQDDAASEVGFVDALRLQGPNDLELSGTGFTSHAGQKLFARVSDGNYFSKVEDTRVEKDGTFAMRLQQSFGTGSYHVSYFADKNGDQVAESPLTDHSWSVAFDGNQKLVTLDVVHDPNTMKGVGGEFGQRSLALDGNFLDSAVHHGGQTVYAAIIDTKSKLAIATGHGVVDATTGLFTVTWKRPLFDGHRYILAYFADVNASKSCDDPDHRWVTPEFKTSQKGNVITVVHRVPDSTDMGACSYFTNVLLD